MRSLPLVIGCVTAFLAWGSAALDGRGQWQYQVEVSLYDLLKTNEGVPEGSARASEVIATDALNQGEYDSLITLVKITDTSKLTGKTTVNYYRCIDVVNDKLAPTKFGCYILREPW